MNAVHSLEHGAVWVTYNSKASDADVKALAEKVKKTPYTLMSPVEDQKDPIMLSAWGHQRTVTSASDPASPSSSRSTSRASRRPSRAPPAPTACRSEEDKFAGWIAGVAAAVVVAAGAITYAVADGDDSGMKAPAADSADAGFARDMAVHHQQAVEMSYIVRDRTKDEEVRRLAYDIAQTQANQRGMMLGWLDLWELPKVSADEPMAWMDMSGMPSAGDGSLMPGMATDGRDGVAGQARAARPPRSAICSSCTPTTWAGCTWPRAVWSGARSASSDGSRRGWSRPRSRRCS